MLPVVLTLIANQDGDSFASKVGDYCYTKWALEAFILANAERFEIYKENMTLSLEKMQEYIIDYSAPAAGILGYGLFKDVAQYDRGVMILTITINV